MWLKKCSWVSVLVVCSCVFASSEVEINRNDIHRPRATGRLSSVRRLKILRRHRRTPCESRQFYCPEGYCIPASWWCDGIVDCKAGDDERHCLAKTSTSPSSTRLSTTTTQTTTSVPSTTTNRVVLTTAPPKTTTVTRSILHAISAPSPSTTPATSSHSAPSPTIAKTSTSPSSTRLSTTTTQTTTSVPSTTTNRVVLTSAPPKTTTVTRSILHAISAPSPSTTPATSSHSAPSPTSSGCVRRHNCTGSDADGTFRSIPMDWLCDGYNDCGYAGADDETNCSSDCSRLPAELRAFCGDGQCISLAVVCNGRADCSDGSDERACYCDETRSKVRCGRSSTDDVTSQCVDVSVWCDGREDCDDASDETLCDTALSCPRGSLRCNSSTECLVPAKLCDGVAHCSDLKDESQCPCSERYGYRCKSGVCVRTGSWCDGVVDCPDASDEIQQNCRQQACPPNLYQCNNGQCVSRAALCDGYNDCGDLSDELDCECAAHEFRCYLSGLCVDIARWCDGRRDCPDSSDEPTNCQHDCPLHWMRCNDHRCLSPVYICDGHSHCIDASDEAFCNVSNAGEMWFDTSSDFLTARFRGASVYLVCADLWTLHLSDLVCVHAGCNSSINTSFAQPDVDSTDDFLIAQSNTEISLLPGTCQSFRAVKLRCQCSKCGVGGPSTSTSVSAPWHVGLFNAFGFLCSGVVVDRRWVLTAVHCLTSHTNGLTSRQLSAADVEDMRMRVRFDSSRPSNNEHVTVSHVILHPSFNDSDRSHDIALVRLSSPLDFGDQLRPVCLPSTSTGVFDNLTRCVVTGLAYTPLSGFSQVNRIAEGDAKLLTYEQCVNATSKYAFTTLKNSSMICATLQPGPGDICFGDSGSLLMCTSNSQGSWTIVGLASWSLTNCAVTVYARITSCVSWIRQTLLTKY